MAADHTIPAQRPTAADPVSQQPPQPNTGLLIAVEGIDRSGKTTLVRSLEARLRLRWRVATVTEPSLGPIGTLFRRLSATQPAPPLAMALLSAADRHAQQPRLIRYLASRDVVLADRYYLSGLAYHALDGIDPATYQRLCLGVRLPNVYLVLHIEPGRAARRAARATDGYWEQPKFAARLLGAYRQCVDLVTACDRAAVIHLDADQPAAAVADAAFAAVTRLLANPPLEGLSA